MKSCPRQARHPPAIKRWLCAGALRRALQYISSKWHSCHCVSPRIGQLNRSELASARLRHTPSLRYPQSLRPDAPTAPPPQGGKRRPAPARRPLRGALVGIHVRLPGACASIIVPQVPSLSHTTPRQCFAKCPFTCQFDRVSDQLCQSLDRLSDHFAKHCMGPSAHPSRTTDAAAQGC